MSKVADILGKSSPKWRDIRKGGRAALRSPEGRIYYGTAQEVRDAAAYPWTRRNLADSIRLYRHLREVGTLTDAEFADVVSERRRYAVMCTEQERKCPVRHGLISPKMEIDATAAARVCGMDYSDFICRCIQHGIDAARTKCWCRKLPFTRQEAAALARCQG